VNASRPPQPPPPSTNLPKPPAKTAKDEAIAWLKAIGTALLIWIVLRSYLVEAFRIPSASMENTLLVGDFLFVNKAVFGGELEIPLTGIHCCRLPAFATPKRDDVVVFRSVEDSTPDLNIVKRVIGAPGDTLQMVHDTIIRNGSGRALCAAHRRDPRHPASLPSAADQSIAAAAVCRPGSGPLSSDDARLGADRHPPAALLGDG